MGDQTYPSRKQLLRTSDYDKHENDYMQQFLFTNDNEMMVDFFCMNTRRMIRAGTTRRCRS